MIGKPTCICARPCPCVQRRRLRVCAHTRTGARAQGYVRTPFRVRPCARVRPCVRATFSAMRATSCMRRAYSALASSRLSGRYGEGSGKGWRGAGGMERTDGARRRGLKKRGQGQVTESIMSMQYIHTLHTVWIYFSSCRYIIFAQAVRSVKIYSLMSFLRNDITCLLNFQ